MRCGLSTAGSLSCKDRPYVTHIKHDLVGAGAAMVQKLVECSKNGLMKWFKRARYGDQCQVVTNQGQIYSHLTEVRPSKAKWKVSGFISRDSDQRFEQVFEIS